MKLRYAIMFLFGLALPIYPEAAQPAQAITAPKAAVQKTDPFECVIASLANDTYELIDMRRTTEYHPYLELRKKQLKIIDALDTFFYKKGNYNALVHIFKFNKQKGIEAAIALFKKVASIVDVTLPSNASLVLQEQKLDWLKKAYKRIKKQYKTFEPTLKSEGISKSLKRALTFNPVTRHWNLTTLAKVLTCPIMKAAELAAISYFTGALKPTKKKKSTKKKTQDSNVESNSKGLFDNLLTTGNLKGIGLLFAINAMNETLSGYFQKLEKEKKELLKRDQFVRYSEEQKKIKDRLHGFISHTGIGDGFSTIAGIQNEDTIRELTSLANWLRKPISGDVRNKFAIMLYGEPGNGKGIITKALANESNTPMITITAHDVKNEQIDSKIWAANKLAQSRDAKSIIVFFDEIDLIVPKKDPAALQAFLTFLDGTQKQNPHVRVLYVFATNYIKKLDPRLLRPGRFKSKIYVGPPTQEQRAKLIEATLLSIFKAAPQKLVEQLAVETADLSRVAIDEAIANTSNHMALTEETPSIESFISEIKKLKEITYHSSKQIA